VSGRRAQLVGIGQSAYTKRGQSEISEYRLALQAILAAVADAGFSPHDVDGLCGFADERSNPITLAADLGLPELRFATMTSMPGGGGACAAVAEAAMAVETGQAEVVVVYRSLCQGRFRIGRQGATNATMAPTPTVLEAASDAEAALAFTAPFGLHGPSVMFALAMRRHMARYGTTSEHLGHVAVAVREHANRNPLALMHDRTLTLEEHQASRMVADPYRLFDCCLETDGACAVVVTSAARAADTRHGGVQVLASVQGATASHVGGPLPYQRGDEDDMTSGGGRGMARRLWAAAGVGPGDVDVLQLYDNFTGQVLFGLEDFGFCEPGESGPLVASGALRVDGGSLPTNTAGGNLSEVYLQGMNHVVEGVRQLRGTSTAQVPGAEVVLVTSSPGIPSSALVLGRA